MAAKPTTKTRAVKAVSLALPTWIANSGTADHPAIAGYICDDPEAESFAIAALIAHGFNLPGFDVWLSSLGECDARGELIERRSNAWTAIRANNNDAALRHLEWMMLRRRGIIREEQLLPLAQRDVNRLAGNRAGGRKTGAISKANAVNWQERCAVAGLNMLANGTPSKDIAGKLAQRFQRDRSTISRVLKKMGVK